MSKILGSPFCYSLQRLVGNYSKVFGIQQYGEDLALEMENCACRFSTTVVSNVHNSMSSR